MSDSCKAASRLDDDLGIATVAEREELGTRKRHAEDRQPRQAVYHTR